MLRLVEKQIQLAFDQAQKEVDDLHQRTREGLATAKLAGKQIGGTPGRKLNVKKAFITKELILKHSRNFGGSLSDTECIRLAGVCRNSFYKYKAELRPYLLPALGSRTETWLTAFAEEPSAAMTSQTISHSPAEIRNARQLKPGAHFLLHVLCYLKH